MAEALPQVEERDEDESSSEIAARWLGELQAAKEAVKNWHEQAAKIIRRYVDDRSGTDSVIGQNAARLNLFTANTQNMEALLFGKTPQVDVVRRYADAADDQARVASEVLERLLNTDLETDTDSQQESMKHALGDRLRVGLGGVRLRYEIGQTEVIPGRPAITHPMTGAELAPAVPDQETRPNEQVEVNYVYWKDQLWSPCRTFGELRWWAFKAEMSRDQLIERFGEELGSLIPLNSKTYGNTTSTDDATKVRDHLGRADVWEIWSKDKKSVYWICEGHPDLLDSKEDPLGLEAFWPFPRPMFANLTTSKLLPTPDFVLAQDLYNEIDDLSTRILLLEECVRVAGLYDKSNEGVKRLISQTAQNELIAVDSWAIFAEKGGVKSSIDWLPIDMVVAALDKLRDVRTEAIGLLYQITGMSDIMRGQASAPATATEQSIKARFASVRVQNLQDEFARFASDVQRIKAEIMARHFQPQTLIERSNIMRTPDAQLAQQAVELIQSDLYQWRISVNPDSVSLTDFAALKQERFEWLQAISQFFQISAPIAQAMPGSMPFLLQIAQWTLAGLKGSNQIEGIFDQAIAAFKQQMEQQQAQPKPPPPPDPKVQAATVKANAEQFKSRADIAKTQMDLDAAKARHAMSMQELAAEQQVKMADARTADRNDAIPAIDAITGKVIP